MKHQGKRQAPISTTTPTTSVAPPNLPKFGTPIRRLNMKPFAPLIATALLLAGATTADAYTRSSSTTGPNGGKYSSSGAGSCSGGKCSSSQSATGPRGNSASRSGNTSCSGGTCSGGATYTGPAGNQVKRSRSTSF
jgi:hypothetical protein